MTLTREVHVGQYVLAVGRVALLVDHAVPILCGGVGEGVVIGHVQAPVSSISSPRQAPKVAPHVVCWPGDKIISIRHVYRETYLILKDYRTNSP